MMALHNAEFKNGEGLILRGVVSVPRKYTTAVVFLHGFPSRHLGTTAGRWLQFIQRMPYLFLTFSFSHSLPSEGRFEDKLMSKEVADIKYAIDFLEKKYGFTQLVLVGHSTGAIDAALYAYKDKRVRKLVLMGGVSDLKHAVRYDFSDQQVHDFWTKGFIFYNRPGEWHHRKKLKKGFYDEFFTLGIPAALRRYTRPLLIIHGENDEAVPVFNAEELFTLGNKPKKMVIIRKADHRFTRPDHFLKVLKAIYSFIEKG